MQQPNAPKEASLVMLVIVLTKTKRAERKVFAPFRDFEEVKGREESTELLE